VNRNGVRPTARIAVDLHSSFRAERAAQMDSSGADALGRLQLGRADCGAFDVRAAWVQQLGAGRKWG